MGGGSMLQSQSPFSSLVSPRSQYGGNGLAVATGVFPQDVWHCEICNRKPGRGFETTVEVLPRLCQIKYASGTLEELMYIDMPRESKNVSGQIVLDYTKAIQESVFDQLRVVREGHLSIKKDDDLGMVEVKIKKLMPPNRLRARCGPRDTSRQRKWEHSDVDFSLDAF